ncbi:MAG: M16 family metallopeptidase [Bacteroidales bacterium]
MFVRKWLGAAVLFTVVLAALAVPSVAQDRSNPAFTVPLDQPVAVDPRITIGNMANGLRYYIRANGRPYQRAELRLVVNVGSVAEDDDQRGLAHFLEHMAFNGSKRFPKQQLIEFMQSIGMRLGPGVNANTSFDETVYALHVPTDNREAMSKAFQFLADIAHDLSFDPDAIEKERGVVIEEWRQGRGADARMRDEQFPILLKGSRYAERVPIGTPESIRTFKPEALKRFYADWYRPDLMAVIAVGDFDKAQVEGLIKQYFTPIQNPVKERPRPSFDVPDHADTLYAVATDPEATATTVGIYNMLPLRDQTTVGAYRQQQVERLYTRMLNSRLSELTLKPNPPFLQAGTDRGIFVRTKEAASLMALVPETGIERGITALITESARAARFGFTPGELEREKRETMRLYESAFAERDKEESADLAAEFIRAFTAKEPTPGITYEYALVQRFVPNVTLEEINKVAKDWAGGSRVVLVNAPKKAGLAIPDATRLASAIAAAASQDIKAYVDVASAQSLLDTPPQPGGIARTNMERWGVIEWTLSNGVKVVLKPTTFKQDEVVFRATSPGGTSLANDQDFVPAMTAAQVVNAGGVGKFNVIQLRNMLAGKAVAVQSYIDETDEGFTGGGSPKDLETMFQLIYLGFTQPRADPAVFEVLKSQLKAMLASQQASPEFAFRQALRSALTQDHFRARMMTPEMVDRMDLQKSFAFYKERFADASDFTFVFAGSFDPDQMKPLVERYLGSLPSTRRKETWRDVGVAPPKGIVERTVRKGIEPKSQADFVFTGPFTFDGPQREVTLDALGLVLENRLREALREALGGTYGVQVEATASRIPQPQYAITIDFGCDPSRTDELVKRMFAELESLKTKGPSDGEVNDAREALVVRHQSSLAQNNRLVAELADLYETGQPISDFFERPMQVEQVNGGAIRDAARRYLNTGNYVRVTLFPEKAAATTAGK